MKTYVCKIHGETEPYISQHMDDRGKLRVFRNCHICKSERNKRRNVEKKEEVADYHAKWYKKNRAHTLSVSKSYRDKLKADIIEGYGGKCECCNEDHPEFLTIDHVNGDGKLLRSTTQKGQGAYRELRKRGYPRDGYRLLCMNCNFSYGRHGYCPHQKK